MRDEKLDEKLHRWLRSGPSTDLAFEQLFADEPPLGEPQGDSDEPPSDDTADDNEPESFLLSDRINAPLKPPEMIFDDLWPARSIGLFTGDGGIGKTHLTLQLLVMIASGAAIQGTPFKCSKARPVVYFTQEDEGDFILDEFRTQEPTLKTNATLTNNIRVVSTVVQGFNLFLRNPASREYMIQQLPQNSVFVFDSWSTFLQSNENDNTELLKEIVFLREIMKARKASCLLLHHRPKANSQTGHQATYRGGTALPNSCRFHMLIEKKSSNVKLSFEKVSRGMAPDPLELRFDESKRLFVPSERDQIISAFKVSEQLTTSALMGRLGLNPQDQAVKRQTADKLRYRSRAAGSHLKKVQKEQPGQDAVWERVR